MPPAIIAAGVTAAAGIGGAIMSNNATKKAANQASDVSLQVSRENNALADRQFAKAEGYLSPYATGGAAAFNHLNALLGVGGGLQGGGPAMQQVTPANDQGMPQPPANWQPNYPGELHYTQEPQYRASLAHMPYEDGNAPGSYGGAAAGTGMQAQQTPQGGAPVTTPAPNAQGAQNAAFDTFRNSTGYQFRLGEGMNALNHAFAGRGSINSGAAAKAALRYGQDFASNEFGNYAGMLSGQAGMGMSGASALAGVGQNFVGQVSANNNSAGSAAANAALMRGSAQANMFGGIGNALGGFAGSSYPYWGR